MPCNLITRAEVCAVIVTYYPDEKLLERTAAICAQVGAVLIVDNTSEPTKTENVAQLATFLRCGFIRNTINRGVATALNQGFTWAKERGFRWILALDQDSRAEGFMIDTLLEVCNSF